MVRQICNVANGGNCFSVFDKFLKLYAVLVIYPDFFSSLLSDDEVNWAIMLRPCRACPAAPKRPETNHIFNVNVNFAFFDSNSRLPLSPPKLIRLSAFAFGPEGVVVELFNLYGVFVLAVGDNDRAVVNAIVRGEAVKL